MSNKETVVQSTNLDAVYTKPNNLVDLFENSVAKFGSGNLFGTKNKTTDQYEWVTFSDVAERVNNLRGALNKLGLSKGEKVGVIVSNSVEWFVCCQATHGLGGVFVPMYEKELQKVWQYILQDADIKYVFVRDQKIYDVVKSFQKDIPTLKDILLFGEEKIPGPTGKTGANPVPSYKPHGPRRPLSSTRRVPRRSKRRASASWQHDAQCPGVQIDFRCNRERYRFILSLGAQLRPDR